MADLAYINGWRPVDMDPLSLSELMHFRAMAIDRWNRTHGGEPG